MTQQTPESSAENPAVGLANGGDSDQEILDGASVRFSLAGKDYTIEEMPNGLNRKLLIKMRTIEIEFESIEDGQLRELIMQEKILGCLFENFPAIERDRERIENHSTTQEVARAYIQVRTLVQLPLVRDRPDLVASVKARRTQGLTALKPNLQPDAASS